MSKLLDLLYAERNRPALDELSGRFGLGDKRTSREVAGRAAERSGVGSAVPKKMLPLVASLVMGAPSKQVIGGTRGAGGGAATRAESGGLLGALLDGDRDGSIWDDVLGVAARGLVR